MTSEHGVSAASRHSVTLAAAVVTLILGACALFLPLIHDLPGGKIVGWLLLLAGMAEVAAGTVRPTQARNAGLIAGAITTLAGLLFVMNPLLGFYPVSTVVMVWLLVRGIILSIAGYRRRGRLRAWALFSGLADLLLGLFLAIGLPIAAFLLSLFGPTEEVVASFAWVLAISFFVTGLSLLALAGAQHRRMA
jgi:uncharacterized membrane protein HdeD (DUF308 family)